MTTSTDIRRDSLVGYLGAVAAELERRGLAVSTVGEPHPDGFSGSLALNPDNARPGLGWGPVVATWHVDTGWSVELLNGLDDVPAHRYLHLLLVPHPGDVAAFVIGLASGQDLGMVYPATFHYRTDAVRKAILGAMIRFTERV